MIDFSSSLKKEWIHKKSVGDPESWTKVGRTKGHWGVCSLEEDDDVDYETAEVESKLGCCREQ